MIYQSRLRRLSILLALATTLVAVRADAAQQQRYCGTTGVWIQILGSGGAELSDQRAGSSYIVWQGDSAKLLVDTGPASALRFEEVGAKFEDLEAIVFTSLQPDHSVEFPSFVQGSRFGERDRLLPVLGPDGDSGYPSTRRFVETLIGRDGAFPELADYLIPHATKYRIDVTDVPTSGTRRWAAFGNATLRLAAIPVHYGAMPALAWRVTLGQQSITFTGDFNNAGNTLPAFAKGSDALVIDHSIEEGARGEIRDRHVLPSQIGRIAQQAGVRMVILSHRTMRTRARESMTEEAIRKHYPGPLIFANDFECWGL